MKLWREKHPEPRLPTASQLKILPHGFPVQIAGMVICRQRPGTAKGHCFISLEDETGIANLFVNVKTFRANKLVIVSEPFLLAEGRIQISEGDQPTVYVTGVRSFKTSTRDIRREAMIFTELLLAHVLCSGHPRIALRIWRSRRRKRAALYSP